MHVAEAVSTRITCRAFLDTPVPEAIVRTILTGAVRTPSGGNLQPWHLWVLAGAELARLKALVRERMVGGQIADGPTEYHIYPPVMKEPYITRKFLNGEAVYAALGISREDTEQRRLQVARNFEFFDAPVGIFFAIDRSMQPGQWADLGMFMQSVMLLARAHGLHTAALESWALRYKTVGEFLHLPPELMLFCGMALGYMDTNHPINRARVPRAPVSEFATFIGFANSRCAGTVDRVTESSTAQRTC
jgi:nitroreductase